MSPHETLYWGVIAHYVRVHYLPDRDVRPKRAHPGPLMSLHEGVIRLSLASLLEEIELGLKVRLHRYLQRTHPMDWWSALPLPVQRSATARYRWSASQLGSGGLTGFPDIAWLTMGDTIKVLETLSVPQLRECLDAQSGRRTELFRTLRAIKAFRDYHVAHPKPKAASTAAIAKLCRNIEAIPRNIRPIEWQYLAQLWNSIGNLSADEQKLLLREAGPYASMPITFLDGWIDKFTRQSRDSSSRFLIDSGWTRMILKFCARLDASGNVYFGRAEWDQ